MATECARDCYGFVRARAYPHSHSHSESHYLSLATNANINKQHFQRESIVVFGAFHGVPGRVYGYSVARSR